MHIFKKKKKLKIHNEICLLREQVLWMFRSSTPGWASWQVVMTGRVIAVDMTWAREQPGRRSEEDNAVAFQVLVAHGDCVGALEVQVFVAGSAGATG